MISGRATYFTDLEMVEYYQKICSWNSKSTTNKNYRRNYARCTTLKNHFLWFMLGCMTVVNISKMIVKFNEFCKFLHSCYCFIYWGIPNNVFFFSTEHISLSLMLFYYVQNVYQKNMPQTRLIIIMIPRVVIISRKASVASINVAEESVGLSGSLTGVCLLRKFLGSKEHLAWLKIDLNVTEIIPVQDYKHTKINVNGGNNIIVLVTSLLMWIQCL